MHSEPRQAPAVALVSGDLPGLRWAPISGSFDCPVCRHNSQGRYQTGLAWRRCLGFRIMADRQLQPAAQPPEGQGLLGSGPS
ncbi:hypothetical protein HaLaN_14547, partial [Haematococcus lacustris]